MTDSLKFQISLSQVTGEEQREDVGPQQRSEGESCAIKWSMFFKIRQEAFIWNSFLFCNWISEAVSWKDLAPRKTLRNPVVTRRTVLFCSLPCVAIARSSGFRCGMYLEWELIWATITLIGWMFRTFLSWLLKLFSNLGASHCGICQLKKKRVFLGEKE